MNIYKSTQAMILICSLWIESSALWAQQAKNVVLASFISTEALYNIQTSFPYSTPGTDFPLADIWGWTYQGNEYALVCLGSKTEGGSGLAMVKVTDPNNVQIIKTIKRGNGTAAQNGPRDVRVYCTPAGKWYAFVSQNDQNVPNYYVNLVTALNSPSNPSAGVVDFGPDNKRVHNLHINIIKGLLFLSDFADLNRPIPVYDIKNVTDTPPNPPVFKGNIPAPSGGRSHDMTADTARVYDASTEKGVTITDYAYSGGTFTAGTQRNHFYNNRRGKNPNDFTSPTVTPIGHDATVSTNGNYLFSTDERGGGDTAEGSPTRQMAAYLKFWDISNINAPPDANGFRYPIRKVYEVKEASATGSFANNYFSDLVSGEASNSIHNVHIRNEGGSDVAYLSYYTKGLRILDVANPLSPTELGYYDTPAVTGYVYPVYNGSWGVYPYFNSGTIVASDMRGLYVFRRATEVSGTISANTTWSGARFITGNITVQNNAILTISAGTTVAFANGTNLTVNAGSKILANGTATQRIKFTANTSPAGRSQYGTIFLYGSGNQFQYCTVEYSDWGLKFVGPASGNVVSNCTFRQNDQAIRIHYNDAEVRDCLIENNRHAFVLIDNTSQYGNIYLDGNTVRNNDRDGIYSINSVVDVFRTVLDNNGLGNVSTYHGVWATSSSDIALGTRFWDEDLELRGGYNTIKNNHGAGVYVGTSSLALLGDETVIATHWYYRAGNNSIHNNGAISGTYSGKEVYNATSTTVEANKNYWGGTPTSSQFDPPVDYVSWLTSPPSGTSIVGLPPGDGFSANPSPLAKSGQSQTSGDDDDTRIKKEMIQNLRALIAQSPESPEAVAALMTIFSFIRTDRNDKLGERNGIYGYLNGLYQAHGQLETGQRALHLMSIERLSRNDFAEAMGLAQTATEKFSGPLRQEAMSLLIRLLLRTGQMTQAQQLFDAYKTDYPDDVSVHELLQDMFKHAEHDFTHGVQLNGSLARPALNEAITPTNTPREFSLVQNFPNPFNPTTEIRYALPQAGKVTLRIFNVLGEQVRVLVDEYKPAGQYTEVWDGKNNQGKSVASGIYIYQISYFSSERSNQTIVRSGKMSLLR